MGPKATASGPRRPARAHAFVADLDAPELDPADRHPLDRVLRLRPDEEITVCDGRGGWRACRMGPTLEPAGPVGREPRPAPEITIAFALVKGERPEWAVQKLTELGVDRIVLFIAARSVVRWEDERAIRQAGRLRRVVREAAMQSRRTWLPEVEDVTTFEDVAARPGAALADPDGGAPALPAGLLLVGPEGGWTAAERARGLPRMALGDHVLRTETAAVAAATILGALRAGLVEPVAGE
ncbi:MAG TPA: RsmE family RNA methyltransferase [Acidimicrobiales bacterium]|nr:RsmE family RNA methyltransferase [Acidimicrobiales bacterium]